jgi:hypothetical protein
MVFASYTSILPVNGRGHHPDSVISLSGTLLLFQVKGFCVYMPQFFV